ncbi:hypothetical protein VCHC46B1_1485 [Vibrio cholerae HC-46B1]|jgi:hypothetical protein|nr:hypothetical protein VCHC43B1_1561 [Vibrio cholerae HC-43B1]EKL00587.1 hypothetical protein VCHC41B1_3652 [Vibrio cholerae HC-41B1]EKL94798.1 hypothetical protein VCHC44C1_3474 [Vibrio cholerae HC-44C1]EKL96501.1 hypothetical protein VCHC46B1_2427 [Vibrio cholerae HC-46B1]EKL96547.1 hypothetical protein VCHC46B1_1485 [Vibrio cholerae HC-46B1]
MPTPRGSFHATTFLFWPYHPQRKKAAKAGSFSSDLLLFGHSLLIEK